MVSTIEDCLKKDSPSSNILLAHLTSSRSRIRAEISCIEAKFVIVEDDVAESGRLKRGTPISFGRNSVGSL